MTAEEYRVKLMRIAHATARDLHKWDHDKLSYYAKKWGYGDSMRDMSINQLKELISVIEGERPTPQNDEFKPIYTKLMQEMIEAAKKGSGDDMATFEQVKRSCILQSAYCQFHKIPFHLWDTCHGKWMRKWWKVDNIRWCNKAKASDVLSAQGKLILDTFGTEKYALVTVEHWPERGKKYTEKSRRAR